jgi:hypothetical protein
MNSSQASLIGCRGSQLPAMGGQPGPIEVRFYGPQADGAFRMIACIVL